MYDWRRYQAMAWTTVKYPEAGRDLLYPCMGLVVEVCSELLPKLTAYRGDGNTVESIYITLGDVLWYVSAIAQMDYIDLSLIMLSVNTPSVAPSPQRAGYSDVLQLVGWVGTLVDRVARKSNNRIVPDDFIKVLTAIVQGLTNIAASLGVSISDVADMNIEKIRRIPNGKENAE